MHRTGLKAFGARDKSWVENMESKVVRPVFGRLGIGEEALRGRLDPETHRMFVSFSDVKITKSTA